MARNSIFKPAFAKSGGTFKASLQHLQKIRLTHTLTFKVGFLSSDSCCVSGAELEKSGHPSRRLPLCTGGKENFLDLSMLAHKHSLNLSGHSDEVANYRLFMSWCLHQQKGRYQLVLAFGVHNCSVTLVPTLRLSHREAETWIPLYIAPHPTLYVLVPSHQPIASKVPHTKQCRPSHHLSIVCLARQIQHPLPSTVLTSLFG